MTTLRQARTGPSRKPAAQIWGLSRWYRCSGVLRPVQRNRAARTGSLWIRGHPRGHCQPRDGTVAVAPRTLAHSDHPLAGVLLVAVIEVVLPFSLITLGQRDVTSGTTGVLIATEPIFVAVIALVIARGRGLPLSGWLGLAIGIVGVVALLGIEVTGPGAFLIVLAALSYATGAILISRLFATTDPLHSTAAMILPQHRSW